jgi:hypothetical protein
MAFASTRNSKECDGKALRGGELPNIACTHFAIRMCIRVCFGCDFVVFNGQLDFDS